MVNTWLAAYDNTHSFLIWHEVTVDSKGTITRMQPFPLVRVCSGAGTAQ